MTVAGSKKDDKRFFLDPLFKPKKINYTSTHNWITGELCMSDSTFMKILAALAVVAFVLVVSTPAP